MSSNRPGRLCALAGLLALARPALAEPGRTAAGFLLNPLAARPAALGGAGAALQGLDALEYNPAGLAGLDLATGLAAYQRGFDGGDYGLLAAGADRGRVSLAIGAAYHNAGPIGLKLSDGTDRAVTAQEDLAPFAAAAFRPAAALSFGATARLIRQTLAETYRASAAAFDAGVAWSGPRGVRLGASLQHVGGDVTFESVGDPLPRTLRAGAAWTLEEIDPNRLDPGSSLEAMSLGLRADFVRVRERSGALRAGAEVGLKTFGLPPVLLRAGWQTGSDQQGLSLGFGWDGERMSVDYAALPTKDLGISHLVTLRFRL